MGQALGQLGRNLERATITLPLTSGRRELQLALDLMQEYPQRCVELVTDEVVNPFFSEIGQPEMSWEERCEQPIDDFAQRFARRHLNDHAIAPSLVVGSSPGCAQLRDDSAQIPPRTRRGVASVCDDAHAAMPLV